MRAEHAARGWGKASCGCARVAGGDEARTTHKQMPGLTGLHHCLGWPGCHAYLWGEEVLEPGGEPTHTTEVLYVAEGLPSVGD